MIFARLKKSGWELTHRTCFTPRYVPIPSNNSGDKMSERGRWLFDRYVAHYLNDMPLAAIGLENHVHNFIEQAHNRSFQ